MNRSFSIVNHLELLGNLLEKGLGLGVVIVDSDYRITHWNSWMERHGGITETSIIGEKLTDRFPDIKKRGKERFLTACVEKGIPYLLSSQLHEYFIPLEIYKESEARLMRQNVKLYPLSYGPNPGGAVIVIDDITESILHEKAIEKLTRMLTGIRDINRLIAHVQSSGELFRGVCETLARDSGLSCVWIGNVVESSRQVIPLYSEGMDLDSVKRVEYRWDDTPLGNGPVGKAIRTGAAQTVHDILKDSSCAPWHSFFRQNGCRSMCALPLVVDCAVCAVLVACSNQKRYFDDELITLLDEIAADVSFGVGSLREMHRRHMAEKALSEEKERLHTTLQSITDAVIATDLAGRVVLMNRQAEELTGWRLAEVSGCPIQDVLRIVRASTEEPLENPVPKLMDIGGTVNMLTDTRLVSKDDSKKDISLNGAAIIGEENILFGTVLVFRDITHELEMENEKQELENKLIRSQRMESLGTLAGGIAHDFNNILASIIGFTELVISEVPPDSQMRNDLNSVLAAGNRAADLVKQILTFSRQRACAKLPVQIRFLIEEAVHMLRQTLPSSVEIYTYFPKKPLTVLADPTQIHQVLVNLCTNASHAMSENGGTLTITIESIDCGKRKKSAPPELGPESYLKLSVADTGHGIPADIMDKIFEPYFSTKPEGKGSGLGLSVVHGIVKTHSGHVTVESTPGKATVFHVYLPLIEGTSIPETILPEADLPGGTESILIVDDEPQIVKMLTRRLAAYGYAIHGKNDSREALSAFKASPESYQLLITDMTMPGMTGDKLVSEIKKIRPDMPIILCTGYNEMIADKTLNELNVDAVLGKPVDKAQLLNTIEKVLKKGKDT